MDLPKDSAMLLSVINTKLRDFYPNLESLCEDMNTDKAEITEKLRELGYEYNVELNRFI